MSDFTVQEFANTLRVSMPTVWKYIGLGSIHAYKIGRSVRIPNSELDRIRSENRIGGLS